MRMFTNSLLILSILVMFGCGQKTIGIAEMQEHYDQVKECMGLESISVQAPALDIREGDSVMCGEHERRGCYRSDTMTVVLPEESDETTIRHEYVHHLMYATTGDLDPKHKSEYFLKCSGIILENDTE